MHFLTGIGVIPNAINIPKQLQELDSMQGRFSGRSGGLGERVPPRKKMTHSMACHLEVGRDK